jgi:diaminohydroxyphosphoribosylaminopyrimidine deaminase/5-amino-6-(5-phosphoribosylamino)uracil reductase
LARAYTLAEKGLGTTHPNPMVGCVVVRDGSIVGEGYHQKAGGSHAEVRALESAGSWARGATVYVTLEPCNHHGKTPPCTQALIEAGVDRVVVGAPDPNPAVSGGGADALRQAGLDVEFCDDPEPFVSLNQDWYHWLETGRPWVTLKTALSLDGHASSAHDVRTKITAQECRSLTMRLRRRATAVAVGGHTALVDRPHLDVAPSEVDSGAAQPRRIVLTRGVRATPATIAHSLAQDSSRHWMIVAPDTADPPAAVASDTVAFLAYEAQAGLRGALAELADHDVVHLLVEAGPALLTSFLDARLIDELVVYHGGGVLGPDAPPMYLTSGAERVTDLDRIYAIHETGIVGPDAVTVWRPLQGAAA